MWPEYLISNYTSSGEIFPLGKKEPFRIMQSGEAKDGITLN